MSSYSIFSVWNENLQLTYTLFVRWSRFTTHTTGHSARCTCNIFQLFFVLTEVIKYEFQYYSIINYLSTACIFIVVALVFLFIELVFVVVDSQISASTFCGIWPGLAKVQTNKIFIFCSIVPYFLKNSSHVFIQRCSMFNVQRSICMCRTINYILRITNGFLNEKCLLWWCFEFVLIPTNFLRSQTSFIFALDPFVL